MSEAKEKIGLLASAIGVVNLNKVKRVFGMEVKLEQLKVTPVDGVNLEQMKLEGGEVTIEVEALEVGSPVSVLAEDGQLVPLPVGTYTLEDGTQIVIQVEGVIAEIVPVQAEEAEMGQEATVPTQSTAVEKAVANAKKTVETTSKETYFSKEEFEALKTELEAVKIELSLLKEEKPENVELSAEDKPADRPIVFNPESGKTIEKPYKGTGSIAQNVEAILRG